MIHADEDAVRSALRKSCRKGDVEEIAHDHFFARSAVEAMADIAIQLSAHSPGGVFTAAQFRDRLDNGRKVAIQVLELFRSPTASPSGGRTCAAPIRRVWVFLFKTANARLIRNPVEEFTASSSRKGGYVLSGDRKKR